MSEMHSGWGLFRFEYFSVFGKGGVVETRGPQGLIIKTCEEGLGILVFAIDPKAHLSPLVGSAENVQATHVRSDLLHFLWPLVVLSGLVLDGNGS